MTRRQKHRPSIRSEIGVLKVLYLGLVTQSIEISKYAF